MKIRHGFTSHLLVAALILAASGCTSLPTTKTPDKPAHRKAEETPTPKITEEPVTKKAEPAEKPQPPVMRKADLELNKGIRNYEEGDYKNAASHFQNALEDGLAAVGDQVTAHKFLAFIYCISGEKMACRAEFRKVFNLNSKFELTPAEAGHPIWGPAFQDVKAEAASRKRKK
jgi:hypothetical protein